MYDRDVRDQERQCLEERLHENIKFKSSEIIRKVKEKTVEQYRNEINGKSFSDLKDLKAYLEKTADSCISNFKISFEDEKVFDSEIVRRDGGELEKTLQSFTAQLVKEAKKKKDLRNVIIISVHSVLAAANTGLAVTAGCLGQIYLAAPLAAAAASSGAQVAAAAAELHADKSDSSSTSQDQDCDKKSD